MLRLGIQIGVSALILVFGLVGLVSPSIGGEEKKYFSGLVGTVVGYWLR